MNIWLINPYGPIPGEGWRPYCFTLVAEALVAEGHHVIWWTSNFAHHFKKFRSDGWNDIDVLNGFKIRLVPTSGYSRNIGFGRILRDFLFAIKTYLYGRSLKKPDLIIYSESPLTFGFAGQRLADFHNCPSIYHQMDLWPELIVKAAPQYLQYLLELIMWPVYKIRQRTYARLSASTALSRRYLDALFKDAPLLRNKPNAVIYNGIDVTDFRLNMTKKNKIETIPEKKIGEIWAVFAGSLGPNYDVKNLCDVSHKLASLGSKIQIVIAGDGPLRSHVESFANGKFGKANLLYLGQLSHSELPSLYSVCDIGLCAYSAYSNVEMPDKFYDYTAAGLPVLVSLTGEVADIVDLAEVGFAYTAGSADDLICKLIQLVADSILMQKMAHASLKLGGQFDKDFQYKKIITVVNQLIAQANEVS